MAKIYANLILHELKTIEDVPEPLRKKVEALVMELREAGEAWNISH